MLLRVVSSRTSGRPLSLGNAEPGRAAAPRTAKLIIDPNYAYPCPNGNAGLRKRPITDGTKHLHGSIGPPFS